MPRPIQLILCFCILTSVHLFGQLHSARNLDTTLLDSFGTAIETHRDAGDYNAYAIAVQGLTDQLVLGGDFDAAIQQYETAANLCRQKGLYKWYGLFNKNIAEIDFMMGRSAASRALLSDLSSTPEIPDHEMAAIRFRLGDLECDLGNYDLGIELLESSLELAQRTDYTVLLGSIYTELGLCVNVNGSKVRAIDYLIRAIPHLSAPKHGRVLGHNYLILSELFDQIGQEDKSLEYLGKGKQIARQNGYERLYFRSLFLEGRMGLSDGEPTAIGKLDSALTFYRDNYLYKLAATTALDIAFSYLGLRQMEAARDYLFQASEMLGEIDDPIQTAKYYEHLSRYYILTDDVLNARSAFEQNRAFVDLIGGVLLTRRSLALEVDLLTAEQRYREALVASHRYHRYKDSVFTLAQNQILFDTEAKYQKEENEKAIALLSAQNQVKDLEIERASRRNMMLMSGLAALAIIVGIGVYSIRLKHRTNRELADKNQIISKSLSEKELLLKEIHHRVKNNLEVISGLLYLQSKYVEDENVLEAIREGQNRVRSMSLIHKNLYQDDNLTGIKMDEYLDKLISTLMKSYKVGDHDIKLNTSIEPLNLDVDTVIPLALIINELISNSLKYACPENEEAELSVSLKRIDQELVLRVADNGPGLPDGFDISKTTSLGYKLIDLFSKKLEGTLSVLNDNGALVILTFDKFKIV